MKRMSGEFWRRRRRECEYDGRKRRKRTSSGINPMSTLSLLSLPPAEPETFLMLYVFRQRNCQSTQGSGMFFFTFVTTYLHINYTRASIKQYMMMTDWTKIKSMRTISKKKNRKTTTKTHITEEKSIPLFTLYCILIFWWRWRELLPWRQALGGVRPTVMSALGCQKMQVVFLFFFSKLTNIETHVERCGDLKTQRLN